MARRKPPDDEAAIVDEPLKKKTVQAKHTVVYDEPITVPASEVEDADLLDFDDRPQKRKPKTSKEERDQLRAKMAKAGVLPSSGIRVSVFKFDLEDDPTSGSVAEKSYCTKFWTNEEAILGNQQHLDVAQKWGPGRYLFMMYKDNKLVTQWEEKISGQTVPGMIQQNGQQVYTDPNNPGVTIQMPANGQPVDPIKQMRESFKMMKEFREAMGIAESQQNSQPAQLSPELQLASFALQDPDIKKKVVRGLFGSNGDGGEKDIPTLLIENAEPIGKMLEGILDKIADRFFGAKQNGQTQMVQTPLASNASVNSQWPGNGQDRQIQTIQETDRQAHESDHQALPGNATTSPEDQLLDFVLDQCARKLPPKIVARRILEQADFINQNAPIQSIDGFIIDFIDMPPDDVLAFISTYSDQGKQVSSMSYAKEWCGQLQAELKPAFENGGQAE